MILHYRTQYFLLRAVSFLCFLSDPSLLEQTTPDMYFPRISSGLLFPFFCRIFKLCTFLLNVERVRFDFFLLLRILSLSQVNNVDGPARLLPGEFLRTCPYVNKNRTVVGKDSFWDALSKSFLKYLRFWLLSDEIFNVKVYLGWVTQSCSLHILLQSSMYCKYSLKLKGYTKIGCATPNTKNH